MGESGSNMLLGEFHHNIDDKGRLVIPTKFREELGDEFIVAKGIEKCLCIYSLEKWIDIVKKLDKLIFTKKINRSFKRIFYSGATNCSFDKSGRISITSMLIDYACIKDKCTIIGVNDHIEVWSDELYQMFLDENENIISEISEGLFEGDIDAL